VYPVGGLPRLLFVYPPSRGQSWYGSSWGGNKVLWIADSTYLGRVLVRGRQLDGSHSLRFGPALEPMRELRIIVTGLTPPWSRPSYTRVRAPGCYGWQVDGTSFTRVIVFKAVSTRSAG
jgi:hypothetical protein